jgi:hypothetical protein
VKKPPLSRIGLAVAAAAALAGAGWMVGSAATVTVTPKNHTAFRTCVLTAYPSTSTVESDSWIDQSSPAANKGSSTAIQVQSRATSKNMRGFIRFDLAKCAPAIAGTATVRTARLRLNLSAAPTSGPRTYNLHRVTGPCPEAATTCWTESGLTWNNQPTVAASPTSTLTLSSSSTTSVYYTFDVTADVGAVIAGAASNYGWRIADSAEENAGTILASFNSKDLATTAAPARAPELVVVYSP